MHEDNFLTKATPSSLIKSMQFFIGVAMGLIALYYASWQWEKVGSETLIEIRELRKDYQRIERDVRKDYQKIDDRLTKLTDLANKHEKDNAKYEVRLEMLELKVQMLDSYHPHEKKK